MDKFLSQRNRVIRQQSKRLMNASFFQREQAVYHHTYDEELLQYEYIKNGDMRSVEESKRLFRTGIAGTLSKDPLRDKKYLFVASITLVTRFCIEGGLPEADAYNLSDLYIQQVDDCKSVAAIYELHTTMIVDFTERMEKIRSKEVLSKAVLESMEYIYKHLHDKFRLPCLAKNVGLSASYLAALFKKETGMTVQEYVRSCRIEAACNMLLYSNYSLTEIGGFLSFSSSSHFISVFRACVGCTPRQYQQKNFRQHWGAADENSSARDAADKKKNNEMDLS